MSQEKQKASVRAESWRKWAWAERAPRRRQQAGRAAPAKAQRTRRTRSTQEALAISPGAPGARLGSEQRSFEGEEQGWAFFPQEDSGEDRGKGEEHGGSRVCRVHSCPCSPDLH